LVGIKSTIKSNVVFFIFLIISFHINSGSIPEEVKKNKINALVIFDGHRYIKENLKNKTKQELTHQEDGSTLL